MNDWPEEKIELSYYERAKFGECPVCHAPHGEACYAEIGTPIGVNINSERPKDGVHLGRLQNAPRFKIISYGG